LIADDMMVITITHDGYVKRLPVDTYRVQGRGGKGLSASNLKEQDFIQYLFVALPMITFCSLRIMACVTG
jgi:DNA gyrase subunit A